MLLFEKSPDDFCNCDPGALLWELFEPFDDVLADSLFSIFPFCNAVDNWFEK